jgi:heme-degrading monooxygenase HmoA
VPYTRVSIDRTPPGGAAELVRRAREGLLPLYRSRPGFIAYEIVATGDDEAVFVSTWASRADAEATVETAAAWAREHAAGLILAAEHHVGDLVFSTRHP